MLGLILVQQHPYFIIEINRHPRQRQSTKPNDGMMANQQHGEQGNTSILLATEDIRHRKEGEKTPSTPEPIIAKFSPVDIPSDPWAGPDRENPLLAHQRPPTGPVP